jgi:hypothetical protein
MLHDQAAQIDDLRRSQQILTSHICQTLGQELPQLDEVPLTPSMAPSPTTAAIGSMERQLKGADGPDQTALEASLSLAGSEDQLFAAFVAAAPPGRIRQQQQHWLQERLKVQEQ